MSAPIHDDSDGPAYETDEGYREEQARLDAEFAASVARQRATEPRMATERTTKPRYRTIRVKPMPRDDGPALS